MSVASPAVGVGELLREWRLRRRLSQLELALEAGVSARHISFVETGRSRPSRRLVLHLAEQLDVPLRERNALLLAAGFAPVFAETSLGDDAMAPARAALDQILAGHEPFPAIVVNRRWDLVAANDPARAIIADGVAEALLEPPVNVLRVALHPDGLAPRISNLGEWSAHLLGRLRRIAGVSGDPSLAALHDELAAYPGVHLADDPGVEPVPPLFVPLGLRGPDGGELRFFNTIATFGTALDITLAELAIESFFPADRPTAEALRQRFG